MKILIAYDGSESADGMLTELGRAGLGDAVHALVFSVAEPLYAPIGPDGKVLDASLLASEETALAMAERARAQLAELFPAWQIDVEGVIGSPTKEIVERATSWGAELVAVGSEGLNAVERFFFGSVSHYVLTHAECSIRISRSWGRDAGEPIRLLLAIDGSEDSLATCDAVLARRWPAGTAVVIVTSLPALLSSEANDRLMADMRALHAALQLRLEGGGLAVTSLIDRIEPKEFILEVTEENGIDCIFMGARGLTKLERALLGSVSGSVALHATCSVEVVRPARGD